MSGAAAEDNVAVIPVDNVIVTTDDLVIPPAGSSSSSSNSSSSSHAGGSSSSSRIPSSSTAAVSSSTLGIVMSTTGYQSSAGVPGSMTMRAAGLALQSTSLPSSVPPGSAFHVAVHLQQAPQTAYTIQVECLTSQGASLTPVAALQYVVFGPGCQTAMTQPFYVPSNATGSFIVRASQLDGTGAVEAQVTIGA